MNDTAPKPWDIVKNPHIRKLCEALQHLPEWLAEREKRAQEEREFRRRVWEDACLQAGLIKRRSDEPEGPAERTNQEGEDP